MVSFPLEHIISWHIQPAPSTASTSANCLCHVIGAGTSQVPSNCLLTGQERAGPALEKGEQRREQRGPGPGSQPESMLPNTLNDQLRPSTPRLGGGPLKSSAWASDSLRKGQPCVPVHWVTLQGMWPIQCSQPAATQTSRKNKNTPGNFREFRLWKTQRPGKTSLRRWHLHGILKDEEVASSREKSWGRDAPGKGNSQRPAWLHSTGA